MLIFHLLAWVCCTNDCFSVRRWLQSCWHFCAFFRLFFLRVPVKICICTLHAQSNFQTLLTHSATPFSRKIFTSKLHRCHQSNVEDKKYSSDQDKCNYSLAHFRLKVTLKIKIGRFLVLHTRLHKIQQWSTTSCSDSSLCAGAQLALGNASLSALCTLTPYCIRKCYQR